MSPISENLSAKLTRAIRELAIKIHPDRFMNNLDAFSCNTKTFSALHSLFLQPVARQCASVNIALRFYLNQGDDLVPFSYQLQANIPPVDAKSHRSFSGLFRMANIPFEDPQCNTVGPSSNIDYVGKEKILSLLKAESFLCMRRLDPSESAYTIRFLKQHPSIKISKSVENCHLECLLALLYSGIPKLLVIKDHLGHLPMICFEPFAKVEFFASGDDCSLRVPSNLSEEGMVHIICTHLQIIYCRP